MLNLYSKFKQYSHPWESEIPCTSQHFAVSGPSTPEQWARYGFLLKFPETDILCNIFSITTEDSKSRSGMWVMEFKVGPGLKFL